MRDFRKITSAVLVVGLSVFLIYRSCHDKHGIDDPDRGGGIGGLTAMVQQPPATPEITSTPEPRATAESRATPDATSTPESVTARQQASNAAEESARRYERAYGESEKSFKSNTDSASQASSAVASAAKRGTEQLQGTWILVDPNNTILELTVMNDTGSLKSYRSETEKNNGVERKVKVIAEGNSIWVVASDADEAVSRFVGRPRIMLAFSFGTSGSPSVVKLNPGNKETAQLKVVSHTR